MGLIKTGLIIGGIVLGLGAIGGVTASVISSQKQSSEAIILQDKPNNKPTEDIQNDQALDQSITVETVIDQLNENHITLYEQNNKKQKADFYAFNVNENNLKLNNLEKIPSGFKVDLSINKQDNKIDKLNDGILVITAKVIQEKNSNNHQEKKLTLTGFKKGDEVLANIFDDKKQNESSKYSLTISPKVLNKDKFVSIEDLNKTDGLTNWLKESTLADTKVNGVKLEGEVKLEGFIKTEEKTYFVLGQKTNEKYIKLIKEEESTKKEVLVESIKTTNLLATDITVIPINVDTKKTEAYISELKATEQRANGYKKEDVTDTKINRDLYFNPNMNNSPDTSVYLKPYLVSKPLMMDENKIDVNLVISFGSNKEAKQFNTANKEDLKVLKDAGFIFNVYGKRLADNTKNIGVDKIKLNNSLDTFFKDSNYKTPIMKMNEDDMNPKKVSGDFYLNSFVLNQDPKNIEVKFGNGSNDGANDIATKQKSEAQNFLLFADYSYKTTNDNDSLMNKVLLTPSLSLIHLEMNPQKA